MAVPTSYTESELAQFMQDSLGAVATSLGYTVSLPGTYSEPINSTLFMMGVTDISAVGAADIPRLRAFAKVNAWRKAVGDTAADFDFSADGGNYRRSQVHDAALKALQRAEDEAAGYEDATNDLHSIGVSSVFYSADPYREGFNSSEGEYY